jgi:2-iminoacetate synthase ThiH
MSVLVDRALDVAGLGGALEARRSGDVGVALLDRLRSADLLALGALADRVRKAEVGDDVRIYLEEAPPVGPSVVLLPDGEGDVTGLELLRQVAIARISGPKGANVRVDFLRCGLELAQVAVGFGANELVGRVANKRGLPLAEGEKLGVGKKSRWEDAEVVKRSELAGFVLRAGRTPVFMDGASAPSSLLDRDEENGTSADEENA